MSKVVAVVFATFVVVAAFCVVASAEGPPYRRTTPRGSFGSDGPELLVGVPGGRAWGIESALIAVPPERSGLRATIEVSDPQIREAFVRIAWYDKMTGRPRQFALTDARYVRSGETTTLEVTLDPPAGAVAYRVRVLARLREPDAVSAADAIRVTLSPPHGVTARIPPTRLLP